MSNPMNEYTPGPWQAQQMDPTHISIVSPWNNRVQPGEALGFGDFRGIHVATIEHHSQGVSDLGGAAPIEHAWANARLIATAPELLRACKQQLAALDGPIDLPAMLAAHRALEAAVAHAEGNQP